jgi:hypothetical protein
MTPKAVATIDQTVAPADSELVKSFKAARRVSSPLIAIETPDPAATIKAIRVSLNGVVPTCQWDAVRGLIGLNETGQAELTKFPNLFQSVNFVTAMEMAEKFSEKTVVFILNAHRQLAETGNVQAVWNLRDKFKMNRRQLVLLGPTFKLPVELTGDIHLLSEPLPTRAELEAIVDQQHKNANLALPVGAVREAALDAVIGLSAYTAEEATAISLTPKGIDVAKLWERKIQAIENTAGLRVWRGQEKLEDLKGLDNVVEFFTRYIAKNAFKVIVFIDEAEKAFAGGMAEHVGDSGVGKDQVGQVLSYIQDGVMTPKGRKAHLGVLLGGVAGCGKSQLAKAVGKASGKPVLVFDLGGMKGGVVGQSEATIRVGLKMVTAMAGEGGRVLFIATANKTTTFSPEMNRRFPDQFFHDLLDKAGRRAVWDVYVSKLGLTAEQATFPEGFDDGWTGAEIERACERAAEFETTVVEAARYIIPSAVSARQVIKDLRSSASGRFLSASKPGWYKSPEDERPDEAPLPTERTIEVGE